MFSLLSSLSYITTPYTLLLEQLGPQLTIMYMCHILYLNVVKMHVPIRGQVLWNALPENIKKCETLNCFKQCVKLHVVE